MTSKIYEILGGIDTNNKDISNRINIVGGYDKYTNPVNTEMRIGDLSKMFVKIKITEWDSFKKNYFTNNKLPDKYYDNFIERLNTIFTLPYNIVNDTDLLYMVSKFYSAPAKQIFNSIESQLNFLESYKKSIQHLFMSLKVFIENLIELFVQIREEYIETSKLRNNKSNNFKDLLERWYNIDVENNIDTSSLILFFNFHPKKISFEKSIPKIHWNIKGNSVDKKIINFLKKIKNTKFEYIGYCPHVFMERFNILLKFPINDLIDIINTLQPNKLLLNQVNIINSKIQKTSIGVSHGCCDKIKKEKFTYKVPKSKDEKVKIFSKYADLYIDLYKQMLPHLIKKEKYINDISKKNNDISNDIISIKIVS
jgi:hypothetical protein